MSDTETRVVYRIEDPVEMHGMWYNKDGVFRKRIHILCPDGIAKDLPMPSNLDLHRKDGRVWNSGAQTVEDMNYWFSPEDAVALHAAGFRVFRFETTLFQELEHETLFCRDGIVDQSEIPLNTIWDITT